MIVWGSNIDQKIDWLCPTLQKGWLFLRHGCLIRTLHVFLYTFHGFRRGHLSLLDLAHMWKERQVFSPHGGQPQWTGAMPGYTALGPLRGSWPGALRGAQEPRSLLPAQLQPPKHKPCPRQEDGEGTAPATLIKGGRDTQGCQELIPSPESCCTPGAPSVHFQPRQQPLCHRGGFVGGEQLGLCEGRGCASHRR